MIDKINESDFCFNRCVYHNHSRNYCTYLGMNIDEIPDEGCGFVKYDKLTKKFILKETDDISLEEEEIIRNIPDSTWDW